MWYQLASTELLVGLADAPSWLAAARCAVEEILWELRPLSLAPCGWPRLPRFTTSVQLRDSASQRRLSSIAFTSNNSAVSAARTAQERAVRTSAPLL